MPRYVDAVSMMEEAKRLSGPITGDGWDNWGVYALIARQPTADVVEVVRCRDCVHWNRNPGCEQWCSVWAREIENPNYFCADGEAGSV